jgi:hypothetical protein
MGRSREGELWDAFCECVDPSVGLLRLSLLRSVEVSTGIPQFETEVRPTYQSMLLLYKTIDVNLTDRSFVKGCSDLRANPRETPSYVFLLP